MTNKLVVTLSIALLVSFSPLGVLAADEKGKEETKKGIEVISEKNLNTAKKREQTQLPPQTSKITVNQTSTTPPSSKPKSDVPRKVLKKAPDNASAGKTVSHTPKVTAKTTITSNAAASTNPKTGKVQTVDTGLTIDSSVTSFSDLQVSSMLKKVNGYVKLNGDISIGKKEMNPVYNFELSNDESETLEFLTVFIPFPKGYTISESSNFIITGSETDKVSCTLAEGNTGVNLVIPNLTSGEKLNFDVRYSLLKAETEEDENTQLKEKLKITSSAVFAWSGNMAEITPNITIKNDLEKAVKLITLKFSIPQSFKIKDATWADGVKYSIKREGNECILIINELPAGVSNLKLKIHGKLATDLKTLDMPLTLLAADEKIFENRMTVTVPELPDISDLKGKLKVTGGAVFTQNGKSAIITPALTINNSGQSFENVKLRLQIPESINIQELAWSKGLKYTIARESGNVCILTIPELPAGLSTLNLKIIGELKGGTKQMLLPLSLVGSEEQIMEQPMVLNVTHPQGSSNIDIKSKASFSWKEKLAVISPTLTIENTNSQPLKDVTITLAVPASLHVTELKRTAGIPFTVSKKSDASLNLKIPELPVGTSTLSLNVSGELKGNPKALAMPITLQYSEGQFTEEPLKFAVMDVTDVNNNYPGNQGPDNNNSTPAENSYGTHSGRTGSAAALGNSISPLTGHHSAVNGSSMLPRTGSIIDDNALLSIGVTLLGIGIFLYRRSQMIRK
ncbi:LPXTG cell wall anchor domain-containing protein [Peribacillus saganii]|uniref:LPXTG cell wall anchor domain-containing protein n=1 Tax=Peribacillus saganii TaxID=2303992 RepID=UPI001313F6F1|nr:LPXTG cell wall anchor domain-containing protein [Peribacillus saganii]